MQDPTRDKPHEIAKLILGLTYRCQSQCLHCSCALHPLRKDAELTLEEIQKLLYSCSRIGVMGVNLFGGEPLLRKDFAQILELAATYLANVTIDSNGAAITPELAALMKSRGVQTLFVSLGGASSAAHNRIQQVDSFDKATRGIRAAVGVSLNTHVSACAFKEHVENGELERLVDYARSLGASGVRVALPMCSGKWLSTPDALLTPAQMAKVRALTHGGYVYLVEEEAGGFVRCHAVTGGSVYVSPYGEVQPCNFIPLHFGNVRNEPLELILERMASHALFHGDFLNGSCPMQRPEFTQKLESQLAFESRLAHAPPAEQLCVSTRCNNHCPGCVLRGEAGALERLVERAGLPGSAFTRLVLHGGEPTLLPGLLKVVNAAHRAGRTVTLHTNGRVFSYPEHAQRFRAAGLAEARVPFFAATEAEFDAFTGVPGSFAQALDGIAKLARAGVKVEVAVPAATDLAVEDALVRALRRAGARRVIEVEPFAQMLPPCANGHSSWPEDGRGPVRRVLDSRSQIERNEREPTDVLLVFPDNQSEDERLQLPHSVLALAAPLVQDGLKVKILDLRVCPHWREELELLLARSPNLACAGITCFIGRQVRSALDVARELRRLRKSLPLVWGGAFSSLMPKELLTAGVADLVVRGEGEAVFSAIVTTLRQGGDARRLPGVSAELDGALLETPGPAPLSMDTLAPTPYHLTPLHRYRAYRAGMQWALYTSRGCPHACRFCAISLIAHRRWRAMSAERVIEEVRRQYDLGAREIAFCEDNFFVDFARVRRIAELMLERRYDIRWSASCRVDSILKMPTDLLLLLRHAGLGHLHIGAESGSDRILEMLDKRIVRSDILAANKICRRSDIVPEFIFMTGFPGETEAERGETLALIEELKRDNPDVWFWRLNHYVPYPGTPLFEEACRAGFERPKDLDGWADYGWHRSDLSNLIDYQVGF